MRTPAGRPVRTVAILCRNHRGFVDALGAAAKLGADALLLNTGFSGPQLADVVQREKAELVIYDEEFAGLRRARARPTSATWSSWSPGRTSPARGATQTLEAGHRRRTAAPAPDKPDAVRARSSC